MLHQWFSVQMNVSLTTIPSTKCKKTEVNLRLNWYKNTFMSFPYTPEMEQLEQEREKQ